MVSHFNRNVKIIPVLWRQWVFEQSVDTVSSRDVNGEAVWKTYFSWWNPYLLWKSGRLSVRGESSAGFHFDKEEIIAFLSEKEKLAVEIRSGVYDRLSEGGGMEMTVEASKGRRIRIYQLKQDSPFMMRFISLAEREKRGFENHSKRSMRLFTRERWIPSVWKMSGRSLAEGCKGILKDMHYPYPM